MICHCGKKRVSPFETYWGKNVYYTRQLIPTDDAVLRGVGLNRANVQFTAAIFTIFASAKFSHHSSTLFNRENLRSTNQPTLSTPSTRSVLGATQ